MSFFTQMSKSYHILSVTGKDQIKLVLLSSKELDTLEVARTCMYIQCHCPMARVAAQITVVGYGWLGAS